MSLASWRVPVLAFGPAAALAVLGGFGQPDDSVAAGGSLPYPAAVARFAARPLSVLAMLLAPLLAAETALSRWLRTIAGVSPDEESVFLSREDLVMLVRRRPDEAATPAGPGTRRPRRARAPPLRQIRRKRASPC